MEDGAREWHWVEDFCADFISAAGLEITERLVIPTVGRNLLPGAPGRTADSSPAEAGSE
jgi:hypothetical protein